MHTIPTPEPEETKNNNAPVIGVSGVPVDHFAIDLSHLHSKEETPAEPTEAPAAIPEGIPAAGTAEDSPESLSAEAPANLPENTAVTNPEEPAPISEEATAKVTPAEESKTEIVGIRFKKGGKIYYFDPCGKQAKAGDAAIVETARGQEYGEVALKNTLVPSSEIVPPIRPMLRIATAADREHFEENKKKEDEAFSICLSKIEDHKLDMKLVEAQYTFDNSKLLFYFTSAGRVDFRDLVKDLASVFRTRIELRQIGIRDEAKLVGGLGSCGRPLCCSGFLSDFGQVSIKMAKEQNLSLNSTKISGTCGRLMCCLRYEYETYLEEVRLSPPVGSTVKTPDGIGSVVEIAPMMTSVKVRLNSDPEAPPRLYHRDTVTVLSKERNATAELENASTDSVEAAPENEIPAADEGTPLVTRALDRAARKPSSHSLERSFDRSFPSARKNTEDPSEPHRQENERGDENRSHRRNGHRFAEGNRPHPARRESDEDRAKQLNRPQQENRVRNAHPRKHGGRPPHRGGNSGKGNS